MVNSNISIVTLCVYELNAPYSVEDTDYQSDKTQSYTYKRNT